MLWYQGESNTGDYAMRYGDELKAMIELWRWQVASAGYAIPDRPASEIRHRRHRGWWLAMSEQEWESGGQADVAAVVTLDAGESNEDLSS
ncbi:MAG: hypothetical protein R2683_01370 [Bifidobacterium adolescentis]